jgi:predicted neuraminidase
MAFWNNNKNTKLISELLTITDEAFIHLCIINYSATWKAQEKQKLGDTNVDIPVSIIH